MYIAAQKIILASTSPRRRGYLRQFGIDFEVVKAEIDETPLAEEAPLDYVERMAERKNEVVRSTHLDRCILSADTIVFLGNIILGKPISQAEAVKTLMLLSGKIHNVATAFCVTWAEQKIAHLQTVVSRVEFADIAESTARAYVETGEPMDKAGAYGIQGRGGALVKRLDGSFSNVVGLPLHEMLAALTKYGIVKTK